MLDTKITIDASAALAVLQAIQDPAMRERMAERVADEVVLPALAKYPEQSHKKMEWKSAKQRAYVMAAIRSGDIQVPYVRTGDYGASFQKQPFADGLALVSNLSYAPFVRGPGQAEYHKGNWTTLEDLADQLELDAALAALAEIVETIGDAAP